MSDSNTLLYTFLYKGFKRNIRYIRGIEDKHHLHWRWRKFTLVHAEPLKTWKFSGSFAIINQYEANMKTCMIMLPSYQNTLGFIFKSWFHCLFILFIYITRYLIRWNVLHPLSVFLPSPSQSPKDIETRQSIYHTPPSAKVDLKVITKTRCRINTKISSPVRLTSSYKFSRSEAPIGFHQCCTMIDDGAW